MPKGVDGLLEGLKHLHNTYVFDFVAFEVVLLEEYKYNQVQRFVEFNNLSKKITCLVSFKETILQYMKLKVFCECHCSGL